MKKFTRREFLKNSLCFSASLATVHPWARHLYAATENDAPVSLVSVIKGMDVSKITREALNAIGGLRKVVKPGQTVFIKPNYIAGGLMGHDPVTSGEIPHPEVVAAVVRECIKAGAKCVIVGEWFERPLKIKWGGEKGREGAQIEKHIELINKKFGQPAYLSDRSSEIEWGGKEGKRGAQIKKHIELINKKFGQRAYLVNLRKHTKFFKYIPSDTKIQWLAIPNLVSDADVVISVAVLKTHHWPMPVTFGMKNFIGIMPSILYGEPRVRLQAAGIDQVIVDINKGIKPKLTVISGVYGMEGDGVVVSFGGEPVDISKRIGGYLVIAGYDPVATDATAARIITKNWISQPHDEDLGVPWYYVKHLRDGFQQGLGEIRKSKILIKGCSLKEVAMSWGMPRR